LREEGHDQVVESASILHPLALAWICANSSYSWTAWVDFAPWYSRTPSHSHSCDKCISRQSTQVSFTLAHSTERI